MADQVEPRFQEFLAGAIDFIGQERSELNRLRRETYIYKYGSTIIPCILAFLVGGSAGIAFETAMFLGVPALVSILPTKIQTAMETLITAYNMYKHSVSSLATVSVGWALTKALDELNFKTDNYCDELKALLLLSIDTTLPRLSSLQTRDLAVQNKIDRTASTVRKSVSSFLPPRKPSSANVDGADGSQDTSTKGVQGADETPEEHATNENSARKETSTTEANNGKENSAAATKAESSEQNKTSDEKSSSGTTGVGKETKANSSKKSSNGNDSKETGASTRGTTATTQSSEQKKTGDEKSSSAKKSDAKANSKKSDAKANSSKKSKETSASSGKNTADKKSDANAKANSSKKFNDSKQTSASSGKTTADKKCDAKVKSSKKSNGNNSKKSIASTPISLKNTSAKTIWHAFKCSCFAYGDKLNDGFKRVQTIIHTKLDARLDILKHPEQPNVVYFAFKGSNSWKDWLLTDIWIIIAGKPGSSRHGMVDFIKAYQKEHPNTKIILTGHSLGAALASYYSSKTGLDAIVFDSPGLGARYNLSQVLCFQSSPNFVNSCCENGGEVIELPKPNRISKIISAIPIWKHTTHYTKYIHDALARMLESWPQ